MDPPVDEEDYGLDGVVRLEPLVLHPAEDVVAPEGQVLTRTDPGADQVGADVLGEGAVAAGGRRRERPVEGGRPGLGLGVRRRPGGLRVGSRRVRFG